MKKELVKESIRYLIVGVITTIIAFSLLWIFYGIIGLEKNISNIVNAFVEKKTVDHFVSVSSYDCVKEKNYNLAVSTYVEKEDTRETIDIVKLNSEIDEIVSKEETLREEINKIIKELED